MLASQLRTILPGPRRAGRRPGCGARPARPDARREPVGRGRVRPVLPGPHGPATAVPPAWPAPGPFDEYAAAALDGTSLAGPARHLNEPVRPSPDRPSPPRAATGCTTCSASTPRRWPPPVTPPIRRRGRRLLDYYLHTAVVPRPDFATGLPLPPPAAGRRPAEPRSVHASRRRPPGWKPSALTCTPRPATPRAGRHLHAMQIPAAMSGFLLPAVTGIRPALASDRPGRRAPGRRPARPGRHAQRTGPPGTADRGLPGRRRQPGPGAGAVPRYRRPARPGQRPDQLGVVQKLAGDYHAASASHRQPWSYTVRSRPDR